jgi:1-deoxyxylulose-5-phosphate synthase
MDYRLLGRTGLRVSPLCLGTMNFGMGKVGGGVQTEEDDGHRIMDRGLDLGLNFFDTANVYGATSTFDRPGAPPAAERESAEQILGRALASRRGDVVVASKSGERRFDPAAGLSRRYVIQQVEQSLRRLGTDYIDLYYAHFPDPDTPLEQTLSAYDDLVRQGKIRYVALSNYPAWQITHALWIADDRRLAAAPICVQVKYNLIQRAAEQELASACLQFGLSIVPYGPLHGGLLASTQVQQREIRGDQRFGGDGFTDSEMEVGREVERLSQDWSLQPYQTSLAWLLARPAVASVIVGAETVDEVTANATAADLQLDQAQLDTLTALTTSPPG